METYYTKQEFNEMKSNFTKQLKAANKIIARQQKLIDKLKGRNS